MHRQSAQRSVSALSGAAVVNSMAVIVSAAVNFILDSPVLYLDRQ